LAEGELGGTGEPPIGPEAPVSVLVVDDQELFRAVLRDVVSATPDMTLVGEAASGEAAVDAVEKLSPQLVVMDKRMPGIGGIEAAQRIRARRPEIVVVLVSVEVPDPELLNASGAVAFLPKRQLAPRALAELWQTNGA
jgi:two-component system, NarL family, nitrate/nitrite response regulator NarL